MKLLIIEDEKRTAENLKRFINDNFNGSVEAAAAFSGEEALAYLKKNKVDFVMTDICLPGMDGITLIKQIGNICPNMHIIVLSAYDDFDYVRQAFLLGVKDYLLKPVDRVALSRILGNFVNETKMLQQQETEGDSDNNMIQHVKKIIKENLETNINLSSLAETVDLNPQYLSTVFKSVTGENLFTYVTRKRIEKAQELLRVTNLKIYEVSEIVGYADTKYFSYVFKKITTMTPGEYREAAQSKSDFVKT